MTNLTVEMQNLLDEYVEEVDQAAKESAKEAAELTMETLKKTSPKRKGKGGKYARGWKVKKIKEAGNLVSYIVYNGSFPGLTHILENGHVAKNQFGTYGRVRAIKHIGPAADAGIQRFDLALKTRLRGK